MRALGALTRAEATLYLRNPVSIFMALVLPSAILLLQGFIIPGTRVPMGGSDPVYANLRLIDLLVPLSIAVALASVAVTNYPSAISGYRETGVLRRLGVTPVGANRILFAQWIVSAVSLAAAVAAAVLVSRLVFGSLMPESPGVVVLVLVCGAAAMMAVGSVIAALAGTAQNAYGIGFVVFMLCMFTAGLWTPGPLMPDGIRQIAAFSPLGSMTQALTAAWYGGSLTVAPFLVMLGWTVICAALAARVFRWR
ncbi:MULTISPECIES: ABC transporter permease [unclassified Arthrobacter]|uniref:ABC transporter permease n=1 Tax=unclassified Arthrobacter TaxID=235627 RepID=UPI001E2BCF90|nr:MULTISPECIES: ABC transporter permease [unclassified Arthrobacter]MCC9145084.1 ABC transporter permease [Arthrobacter sp. zg-Y919]MDK1276312.1 ABC transporter permease [Arthrobacter sp. zg.Y919]WIB02084.1 ABC transporter permease [Arthrobacter sp. zg-Y919]